MSSNSIDSLVNKGLIEINPAPFEGEATLVIVGLPRSGTSMIASLYQSMGIFMGNALDHAVFEDVEVAKLIESGDYESLRKLAESRDSAHGVWGFKRPNAYKNLANIAPLLRKPRVVVLFRDILAIAMRNHVSMQMDVLTALPRYVEEYRILAEGLKKLDCPALLVSYEKFAQFPEESITRVAQFAGVELGSEDMKAAMAVVANGPEAYLQSSRLHYTGHVDRIVQGKLRGWAMAVGEPKVRAVVHLLVNGQVTCSTVANKSRKDLVAANIGDGKHGFELPVDPGTPPDSIIQVTAGNAKFLLANGGKSLSQYQ